MSECKHIFNAHAQCQWCHRMKKDIEYEDMKAEIERLQKDRSRSENELDRLREWVAAVEDGYDKQAAEIERLKKGLRRFGVIRIGAIKKCLVCGASADLGDAIEHTSECPLNEGGGA